MKLLKYGTFELGNFVIRMAGIAPAKVGTFLLPTLASTVLTLEGYTDFALAYVIGMAVSAFSGESLSATVSKYVQDKGNILDIFLKWGVIIFVVTVSLTSVGYFVSLRKYEISLKNIQIFTGIFFFCAINIFIPSSLNLILFHRISIKLVGLIILIVFFAIIGASFFGKLIGYVGFILGYSVVLLFGLLTLLLFLANNNNSSNNTTPQDSVQFFKSYFLIALAASFGGPVHGICMLLLGSAKITGRFELAIYVLYYPFAMLVSFIPSLNSTFIIRKLAKNLKQTSQQRLREILISNIVLMVLVCAPLLMVSTAIHQYYQARIGVHQNLLPKMVQIGFLIGLCSVSSSILISLKNPQCLLKPSIIQALCYAGATYVGVNYLKFDASSVGLSSAGSLLILLTYHFLLILNDN